jgi:hypothetical protein
LNIIIYNPLHPVNKLVPRLAPGPVPGVIGFVFLESPAWFIFKILCCKEGCISFILKKIGFVLHN